jgi:hypothetical protein
MNLYHLVKNGIVIMESANFGAKSNKNTHI